MKKIFAIDQSYTCSGLIIIEGDHVAHIEKYVTDDSTDKPARAWELANYIGKLVDLHKPDVVGLEGLAFGMRGDATRDLAGLQFIIMCVLRYIHNMEVAIVTPNTAKKTALHGKATKMEMYEALPDEIKEKITLLGVKKTTGMLDITDAYWIAKTLADPLFEPVVFSKPKKRKKK